MPTTIESMPAALPSRIDEADSLEFDERPFHALLTASDGPATLTCLGIAFPRSDAIAQMTVALAVNAWLASLEARPGVFYSRDRNHYSPRRPYWPFSYTLSAVVEAVALLEAAELVEHRRTLPSPRAKRRSMISATPRLVERLSGPAPVSWSAVMCGSCAAE
jgi:hypothetical protein